MLLDVGAMIIAQAVLEKGMLDGMLMSLSAFTREVMVTFQQNPAITLLLLLLVVLMVFRLRK